VLFHVRLFLGFPVCLLVTSSSCTRVMQYSTTAPKDFRKGSVSLISSALFLESSLIAMDVRTTILFRPPFVGKSLLRFVFKGSAQKMS